jgi:GT2 family glycosyltransferase
MLTVIIINYHTREHVQKLLQCLEAQTVKDFQTIVIDNDENNRGFAGGCNEGIRQALARGSEWILLLNPDTTVEPDFIAQLPREEGIVGLPLDEGGKIAYAGIVKWLRPTLPHLYQPCVGASSTYVIGAGMLIHRDVFTEVGPLDERYFLYFEDADFSMRARKANIPIMFLTSPVISHGVSQSTKQLGSPLLLRYHARNALLFNWNHGPWWVRAALPFWSFFAIVKQLTKMLLMPSRRPQSWAIAAGIVDFYAHRFGKIDSDRH